MYLILINIATFIVYGMDKYFAIHDMWRISEKALIALAVAGGSIGAYVAMLTFRHKTMHKIFTLGVPAIIVCQVIVLGMLKFR